MASRWAAPPFHCVVERDGAWDLVVKVKYGDTLKRFNACVNGPHFDHDLATLRTKIASAFKFSPDADFILTYTDEDGDVVMLDDDNDLRDAAVAQKLNPLRINVQLKSSKVGEPRTKQRASNSRSPRSTVLEDQLAQVKSAIDEALKFVPEQVPAVLAKLSHDMRSRAASSAPSLAELLDRFAKILTPSGAADGSSCSSSGGPQTLGNSKIKHGSAPMTGSSSEPLDMQNSETHKGLGLKSVLSEDPIANIEQAPPLHPAAKSLVFTSSGGMKSDGNGSAAAETKSKSDDRSKGKSVVSSFAPPVSTTSRCAPRRRFIPDDQYMDGNPLSYVPNPIFGSNGMANGDMPLMFPPLPAMPNTMNFGADGKVNGDLRSTFPPPPPPNIYSPYKLNIPSSVDLYLPNPEGIYSSGSPLRYDMPSLLSDYVPNTEGVNTFWSSYRDPSSKYGNIPQTALHRWIQCDGCGVTPIYGPRYKSNVKEDYDLCGVCFSHMGNEAEYTKLDRPASVRDRRNLGQLPPVNLKPDCCFIKDVTVPDGTPMAPSTQFTKVWRMRNSGSTMWPFGTQLAWVGGDQFACQSSVKLAISFDGGLPADQEIDVAVNFIAPAKPGRYISYWRLALPSGQKFGQRVWVHIQVDQPIQTSGKRQTSAINLNLPPEANSTKQPFIIDVNSDIRGPDFLYRGRDATAPNFTCHGSNHTEILARFCEQVKPKGSEPALSDMPSAPTAAEPVQAPITDAPTSAAGDALAPMPAVVPAPEAIPPPNPAPMPAAVSVPVPATAVGVPVPTPFTVPTAPLPCENYMEEKQLRELEQMGFMQADLNKEILRQNKYDLEQSIVDLCGFNEWDPVLELSELMNKEVVESDDDGYIDVKQLVKDLLARAKKDQ
ncbi:hypothetical protein ACP70R_011456 [Stipagrostis hirtigluma subsp. patula]